MDSIRRPQNGSKVLIKLLEDAATFLLTRTTEAELEEENEGGSQRGKNEEGQCNRGRGCMPRSSGESFIIKNEFYSWA
jgi:hypothetical protein